MVSVIIPTYNRVALLKRAVQSVLRQTYSDFEILIIDDGSTDETEKMVHEELLDPRIRYDKLSINQGVHAARNRGLDIARGEFIVFLDSDDELLPIALQRATDLIKKKPEIQWLSAALRLNDSDEIAGMNLTEPGWVTYPDILRETFVRPNKAGFGMFRKTLIGETRFAMQNLDFIFFRHLARKASLYYIPEPLGIYYRSPSDSGALHLTRLAPNTERSIKRGHALAQFLKDFRDDFMRYCPQKYSGYAYGAGLGLLLDGQQQSARILAMDAVRFRPTYVRGWVLLAVTCLPGAPWLVTTLFKFLKTIGQLAK